MMFVEIITFTLSTPPYQHTVTLITYRSNEVMMFQCVKVLKWLHWKLIK